LVLKKLGFKNPSLWQRLISFVLIADKELIAEGMKFMQSSLISLIYLSASGSIFRGAEEVPMQWKLKEC